MSTDQPVATFISQSDVFCEANSKIYTPLDSNCDQIRLMHIAPGQYHDPIVNITISVVNLADEPEYEAISYTWGDLTSSFQIYVHGIPYNVSANQYYGLRRFRLVHKPRMMWMDVICIDQSNVAERSRQVSLMHRIYASAARTQIWLGEPQHSWHEITDHDWSTRVEMLASDSARPDAMKRFATERPAEIMPSFMEISSRESCGKLQSAIYFLRLFRDKVALRHFPYCSVDEHGGVVHCRVFYEVMKTLQSILENPWWTRVWVLQEAILSKVEPTMHIGSEQVPLQLFESARDGFMAGLQSFDDTHLLDVVFDYMMLIDDMYSVGRFASSIEHFRRKPAQMALNVAVDIVDRRSTADPRDFVYGIMGLVKEDQRENVDYGLDTNEVFASVSAEIFFSFARGMDLLQETSSITSTNLSSWVVDWAKREVYFQNSEIFYTKAPWVENDPSGYFGGGVVQLLSNKIDRVDIVLDTEGDQDMYEKDRPLEIICGWLRQIKFLTRKMSEPTTGEMNKPTANFMSTIFREAIADEKGKVMRSTCAENWAEVLEWFENLKDPQQTTGLSRINQTRSEQITKIFGEATENSSLCVTDEGRLCMARNLTQPGDLIYHIYGCNTPIVLRSAGILDMTTPEELDGPMVEREVSSFKVVGPCYMEGCMGLQGSDPTKRGLVYLV